MVPTPSLQDVIHLVEADTDDEQPLSRLRVASAVVQNLAEIGDAALGYFVDQARHAGHSWSEIGEALGVSKQAAQQKQTVRLSLGLNAPTFERFTARARNVVSAAVPIARQWGHDQIGPEHLLLALYREPNGIGAQILNGAGLTEGQAEQAMSARVPRGAGSPDDPSHSAKAIAVFTGALAAALEMGHNYIGTEHILLGLARGDGLAADILEDAGLDQAGLEGLVGEELARYSTARQPLPQPAGRGAPKRAPAKKASPVGKKAR
jgi:hypothetical protein